FAIEVANQVPLMSIGEGYPNDLFKNKSVSQSEVLFQLTPVDFSNASSYFLGFPFEYFFFSATTDIGLILKETPSDIRSGWIKDTLGNQLKVKKIPNIVTGLPAALPSTNYYPPIIRSSEMFLTAAEASAKTGDEFSAKMFLNAIRKRANLL